MEAKNVCRIGDLRVNAEIVMFGTDYGVPILRAGETIPVFKMTREPMVDKRRIHREVLV